MEGLGWGGVSVRGRGVGVLGGKENEIGDRLTFKAKQS